MDINFQLYNFWRQGNNVFVKQMLHKICKSINSEHVVIEGSSGINDHLLKNDMGHAFFFICYSQHTPLRKMSPFLRLQSREPRLRLKKHAQGHITRVI